MACAVWLARDFLRRTGRPIDIPPCAHDTTDCPPIAEGASMTATPTTDTPPKGFGRRNTHCSNCGDERGGPFGHEISECRYRSGMTAAQVAELLPEHRRAEFWSLCIDRYFAANLPRREQCEQVDCHNFGGLPEVCGTGPLFTDPDPVRSAICAYGHHGSCGHDYCTCECHTPAQS